MLEINEIFGPTIQGEGKLVGTPSVFIRFGSATLAVKVLVLNMKHQVALKNVLVIHIMLLILSLKILGLNINLMKRL